MDKETDTKVEQQPVAAQGELFSSAEDATRKEHELTFWPALKLYPKAAGWSVMMSTALVMDGYDFKLIGTIMIVILLVVGGLGVAQRSPGASSDLARGIGALLMFSSFVADLAISPILYAQVSELPSSLLRSKSVVIARFSYAVLNVIANVITPYQLNPSAWGWGAISAFFWGGACLLGWTFTYFCVPESKGRTVTELDFLFERKVSARKFTRTAVRLQEMAESK